MDLIRAWIYAAGLRPKPGSIFYSPSRAYMLALKEEWGTCNCSIHDIVDPWAAHARDCPMYD